MAEPTSSKMDNTIALTTQGDGNNDSDYDNDVYNNYNKSSSSSSLSSSSSSSLFRKRVDTSASPSFPRSTGTWWFGCSSANQPLTQSGYYDGDGDDYDDDDGERDGSQWKMSQC